MTLDSIYGDSDSDDDEGEGEGGGSEEPDEADSEDEASSDGGAGRGVAEAQLHVGGYGDKHLSEEDKALRIAAAEALESRPPVLILTSHLGKGSTGNAHGGFLVMKTETGTYRLHVVAKLAFEEEQKERLETEYNVYNTLRAQGVKGIPTALGIYRNPRIQTAPFCLITTYAGGSLLQYDPSTGQYSRMITSEQRHVSNYASQACN